MTFSIKELLNKHPKSCYTVFTFLLRPYTNVHRVKDIVPLDSDDRKI